MDASLGKEFTQNAEDAGASPVKLILDWNNPASSITLMSMMTGVAPKMRTLWKLRFQIAMTIVLVRGKTSHDLAHGLTAWPHGQGVAPNYSLTHSVTHSHVACLVGLHLRLRPASNARIGMTSGGVAFNLQVVQVALLFDWRWNPTSERLSILCQTTFLSWKLPKNGTGVETLDFVRTIVVDSGV